MPQAGKNGRGAYICPSKDCYKKAVKNKGLERSLKMAIPKEVYEALEKGRMDNIGGTVKKNIEPFGPGNKGGQNRKR